MNRHEPEPLHILYSFPHPLDRPGIATTALHEVRSLANRGHHVELICTSRGDASLPSSVQVRETMTVFGRRIPHRVLGVQRAYTRHDRIVARRLRSGPRPDLVHAWPRGCLHTFDAAARLAIPSFRECPNPHTAAVYRDSAAAVADAGVSLPSGHSHATSDEILALERREFELADALLAPSEFAASAYVAEGIDAAKVLRHRYGCDITEFTPTATPPSSDAPLQACFLGRGDPTKGLHVALQAWLAADPRPGSLLRIGGTIDPAYATSLASYLADPRIVPLGFVTDTAALLRGCDLLILPSWTEGSALVTYEAQASGCLPLVSRATGAFGDDGKDFVSHPVGDVAALTSQITALDDDRDRLGRLRAGLVRDRRRFSWDAAAEQIEQCYRHVREESRSR